MKKLLTLLVLLSFAYQIFQQRKDDIANVRIDKKYKKSVEARCELIAESMTKETDSGFFDCIN